ncbi:MAG: ATPase [Alphaproteobacteria bacterium]|nr:ATPase [Alphaproteobacteria bacterium]
MAHATDHVVAQQESDDHPTTLNLRRVFEAPRELVWLAWTNPEMTVRWLGPVEWPAARVTQDLRVGGAWSAVLESANGDTLWQGGVYRLIEPPKRLVFTFAWGERHEDGPPVETLVSIELTAISAERTIMEFTQTGLKSSASASGHQHGWTSCFDRLDEWLANPHQKEKSA